MFQNIIIVICNIATTFWGYMKGLFRYLIQPFSAFGDRFTFAFTLFDGSSHTVFFPEIPVINDITNLISDILGALGIELTILSCLIIACLTTFVTRRLIKIALNS